MIIEAYEENPEIIRDTRFTFENIDNIVVKENGTEIIDKRKCVKWVISMGKFFAKISVDPNLILPIPQDDKVTTMDNNPSISINPGYPDTYGKFANLLSQKGIPLKSDVELPFGLVTVKISKKATKIVEGPIPASVFALPEGYTMEDQAEKMFKDIKEMLEKMITEAPPKIRVDD
jgi:hypothetical protein